MMTTKRKHIDAPIKYHGGKHYLQHWLHENAPPSALDDPKAGYTHRNIAYAGMLNEFWNWEPVLGISEAVNDISQDVTNFFRVLQEPKLLEKLQLRLNLSPFSRDEFELSAQRVVLSDRDVDRAAKFFIRHRVSRQGLGKCYATPTTRTRRMMNENVSAYLSGIDGLDECANRLISVEIENVPATKFIKKRDHKRSFTYLDPTYLVKDEDGTAIRVSADAYEHEMTLEQHLEMLDLLTKLEGKFMLSGYPSKLYGRYAKKHGWRSEMLTQDCKSSAKKEKEERTEVIWMNY